MEMTVTRLKQYRAKVREVKLLEKEIAKKSEYRALCETMLAKERAEIEEIEQFIAHIPLSETRQIFCCRYLFGGRRMSWQEIAFKIGKTDESYPRRKHREYMQKIKAPAV